MFKKKIDEKGIQTKLTEVAFEELNKTKLNMKQSAEIVKIVTLGIKNGLTDEQIAKQIDDKFLTEAD